MKTYVWRTKTTLIEREWAGKKLLRERIAASLIRISGSGGKYHVVINAFRKAYPANSYTEARALAIALVRLQS